MPTVEPRRHPELDRFTLDEWTMLMQSVCPRGITCPYEVDCVAIDDEHCERPGKRPYPGGCFYLRRQRAWLIGRELRFHLAERITRGQDRIRRQVIIDQFEAEGLTVKSIRFRPVLVELPFEDSPIAKQATAEGWKCSGTHCRLDLVPEVELEFPGLGRAYRFAPNLVRSALLAGDDEEPAQFPDLPPADLLGVPQSFIDSWHLANPPPGDDAGIGSIVS